MIIRTIEHPLRKITFEITESIPATKEDDELISAFLLLHDAEKVQSELSKKVVIATGKAEKEIEKVQAEFNAIKALVAEVVKASDDLISVLAVKATKKWETIQRKVSVLNRKFKEYDVLLKQLHEVITTVSELNRNFIEYREDNTLWESYDDIMTTHFNNYEHNSIDIVSFEDEDERFKSYVSVAGDRHKGVIDYANATVDKFNVLCLETTMEYALWEELGKRLVLTGEIIGWDILGDIISAN